MTTVTATVKTTKTTATTATHGRSGLVAITVTQEQADRLLALLDQEIAGQKNRLVFAVLRPDTEFGASAHALAQDAEDLNNIAAALRRLAL